MAAGLGAEVVVRVRGRRSRVYRRMARNAGFHEYFHVPVIASTGDANLLLSVAIRGAPAEHNEETPKKGLGGLTPAAYAKLLAANAVTLTLDSGAERY